MNTTPPEEPLNIRNKSLTPQSPQPIKLSSPSSIPLLNQQMDPSLDSASAEEPNAIAPNVQNESVEPIQVDDHSIPAVEVSNNQASESLAHDASVSEPSEGHVKSSEPTPETPSLNPIVEPQNSLSIPTEPSTRLEPSTATKEAEPITENSDQSISAGIDIEKLLSSLAPQLPNDSQTQVLTAPGADSIQAEISPAITSPIQPLNPLPPRPEPVTTDASTFDHNASFISLNPLQSPSYAQTNSESLKQSLVSPGIPDEDSQFSPELEKAFEQFLEEESKHVADAKWDKFPDGSRLFIGNLSTEKVSKRDVFFRFSKYGKLAQISLKQAFGFVQFLDSAACAKAKDTEQDAPLKGRKMHLEISRPQNKGNKDRNGRRRSRSPKNDNRNGGNRDRDRDRDRDRRRDDYRPHRSPSPRRHGRRRSPDLYDGRARRRSPSPNRRNSRHDEDDDLPLPRRSPRDVPEVQIIVFDDLDRNFIRHVENALRDRGIRTDVLIPSPRLSEQAIIRRQILEGVLAVLRLTRSNQNSGRVPLQLFDRRRGAHNVQFEEYAELDPNIAAELVVRARQTHNPQQTFTSPQINNYGMPPGPTPYAIPQPSPQMDYSSIIAQLGSRPDLQAALSQATNNNNQSQIPGQTADIAKILAAATGNHNAPSYAPQSNHQVNYASLLGSTQQPTQPPQAQAGAQTNNIAAQQPNLQELMAQLSRYQK